MSNDTSEPVFSNYGVYEINENLELTLPNTLIKIERIGENAFSYFRQNSEGKIIEKMMNNQGITFEKVRRATNRSLKMTIWSLGSDLCYEEKISARGRHYNTIRQGAPFHHCLSGRRHFNTTTRSL